MEETERGRTEDKDEQPSHKMQKNTNLCDIVLFFVTNVFDYIPEETGGFMNVNPFSTNHNLDLCVIRRCTLKCSAPCYRKYLRERDVYYQYVHEGSFVTHLKSVKLLVDATKSYMESYASSVEWRTFYDTPNMTQEERKRLVQFLAAEPYGRDMRCYKKEMDHTSTNIERYYSESINLNDETSLKRREQLASYQKPSYHPHWALFYTDKSQTQDIEKELLKDRTLIYEERYGGKRFAVIPDCMRIARNAAKMVVDKRAFYY